MKAKKLRKIEGILSNAAGKIYTTCTKKELSSMSIFIDPVNVISYPDDEIKEIKLVVKII